MLIVLRLFWAFAALELMLWLIPNLKWRRVAGGAIAVPVTIISFDLLAIHPSVTTCLVFGMTLYRLVNLLRLVKGRVHEQYLRKSTLRTSVWIALLQSAALLIWRLHPLPALGTGHLWFGISILDLGLSAVLLASTIRHLLKTRPPQLTADDISDRNLPTLTVAIPARNETEDLEECLASVIASNYPKLEVLVLDDCSQNKRTPEIIRSFAHDGVRFLQGVVPQENWLAKNQAYQQLYEAANGELILFCGVDVRFSPNSLRLLVGALVHKKKSMISIIPRNAVPSFATTHATTLIQPMRYAWELALPRRLFRRPPVLSTCWLIKRDVVASAGGFAAVSRSIVPESYFARVSAVHDGYSFMQSSERLGIASNKSLEEQRSTTIRVEYPRVHRRIEYAMLLSAAELIGIITPYCFLVLGLLGLVPTPFAWISAASIVMLTIMYSSIVALTYRLWLTRSLLLLPIAALVDVVLLNFSMLRYEFFSVIWKDRNVCIPVMRVVDHLPESVEHR